LTGDKTITSSPGEFVVLNVASGTVIYAGGLVAVDTNVFAVPASDTATLKVVGIASRAVDQRAGVYDSAKKLLVRRGVFLFKNGGSLTDANIGDWAYVEDDQTVTTAAEMTNDLLAGVIVDVDADGVWVDVGAVNRAGAIAGSTLDATGNATIGGTLAVTGASTLTGALAANGGVNCDSGKFTVADTSGNTAIAGTLAVTGATTINGAILATNTVRLTGLPTATNGLSAGALWNDSNAIKIMP
jgi:hypothetical protein